MPLRVGIDGTIWTNKRGFGRYVRNLVGRLVELDAETEFVFVGDQERPAAPAPPERADWRHVSARRMAAELTSSADRRALGDLLRLRRAVQEGGFDVFLFPCVDTYYPVSRVPTVVAVYDAISDDFARLMLPERRARFLWRLKQRSALRRATRLFTISEASRAALSRRHRLDPLRLPALPGAPDPVFTPRPAEETHRTLAELGLPAEPFVLYGGGIGAHKGLETLLRAYEALAVSRDVPPLLVTGEFDAPGYRRFTEPMRRMAANLRPPAEVRFTGWVHDDQLAALYSGAVTVVVPSLAEGFGLPSVEAGACGAALLLSDIPPHHETIGDAAVFAAPGDAAQLTGGLGRLLDDAALRRELGRGAREEVARLSWDRSAAGLMGLLREAASRRSPG